jgi:hypothetical protein
MSSTSSAGRLGIYLGRSLFPLTALVVVLGAFLWGPWISLAIAYVWWRLVARIG